MLARIRKAMDEKEEGFTLIELLVVIIIIGILAAIAIPSYQSYTIRGQVTEGLNLADGWKAAVSEYYAQLGAFPTCSTTLAAGAAGCISVTGLSAGKYVSSISLNTTAPGGQIKIVFAGSQANRALAVAATDTLTLSPGLNANGDIIWVCGKAVVPASETVTGPADATTIPSAYLPAACHT
jgi:type IV pilus assembly protein PilA